MDRLKWRIEQQRESIPRQRKGEIDMLKTKFQSLAQVVGCVTIGLLAVYGLLTLFGGGSALASVSAALGTASGQASGSAAVLPSTFNYQGLLRNPDGSLTTGSYTITARIYDAAASGSALYTETFPSITVRDGLFNVVLGDNPQGQNLTSVFAEMPRYIGIQLDDTPELIPRQRLHGVPWALYATNAMTATTLVPNATINGLNGLAVDGNVTVTGKVTSAPTASGDSSTTVTTKGYVDIKWPDGSYCIMRSGGTCPAGFLWGEIGFDTEDDYPANYLNGTVGDVWDYGHRSSWAVAVCCK